MKYPKCILATIISPGAYCVVSQEEEHMAEVKQLEESLAEEIQNSDIPDINLKCQMCVAVSTPDGKINRGVIEEKISSSYYEVSLIDYGKTVVVEKSNIYVITNENYIKVEPLSFIVKLFGVLPSKFCMVKGQRKARVTENWEAEAETFVKNLFSENQEVIVQSVLIKQRTVYGDIFFKVEPKKYGSLRKILCKKEYCGYSKTNFLRQEGLDLPSNESPELKTKMEFVEKWQKENLENFKSQALPLFVSHSTAVTEKKLKEGMEEGERTHLPLKMDVSKSKSEEFQAHPGPSQKTVTGRGKIKLLLSKLRSLQGAPSATETKIFESQSTTSSKLGLIDKERTWKKISSFENENKTSSSGLDVKLGDEGQFDDAEVPRISQKVEDAVVKPGECSLISDDNPMESSNFEESPPPLVRKKSLDIELIEQPNRVEKTEVKTNSEKSSSSHEIKVLKLPEDKNWLSRTLINDSADLGRPLKISLRNYWTPFVLFGDSVVEPVNTFGELPIQRSIIENLEKGGMFNELSQLQRWAIPAIRKQHDTIIIGSSKTGKTLSYLVPLIDYIQDEFYFEELPGGNGPTVVIVASSSRVCESIYYMCHTLLGHVLVQNIYNSNVKVVLAHGNGCEKEVWVKLTNGCDILISTPHCLARLLEYPVLTNLERLTCLVLDEVDVISEKHFKKPVRLILEKAKWSTKNRHYQKIFCGEKWTPDVENLVTKYVQNYALIIGSYMEAVIYERLKPTIYLVLQSQKAETLLEKIKNKIGKVKICVICESANDAIFVDKFLTEKEISSLVAHEKMMADKLTEVKNVWRAFPKSVLVLTDGVLSEMKIREAQVLVHYGLPVKSKTNFFLRYSAFENFIRESRNIQHNQSKNYSSKLVDIILVDDENHFQLPHIVDFVLRLRGQVSEKVIKKCEEIRRLIEVSKADAPICRNLLTLGRCWDSKFCSHRHALVKSSDSPRNLPSSGWVNFSVVKVHDASSMSVRLFEHVDVRGQVTKLEDEFLKILVGLVDAFKVKDNRKPHGTPSLRDICAVMNKIHDQEVFHRAQVVENLKMDEHGKPAEVRVRLLDQGDVWKCKVNELYELPEELRQHPPVAVDVKTVGLQPLDFDMSWSQVANDYVRDVLTQKLEENQYWSGKIVLALNGTLFLDPIKRKEFLPHLKTHVFDIVLQEHLIDNRVAVRNEEHLPSLQKLCLEGDIEVPKEEELKRDDTAKFQPQWAFFDSDFVEVKFLAANHTSTVFLQLKKFEKLLDDLEKHCQSEGERIQKEILTRKSKKSPISSLTVGAFCLAKFEDGRWNRGRIDDEAENTFYVFFVDHGDFLTISKTDVIPISQSFLLRLPCQAIECSLIGIHPDAECSIDVLQEIYDFSDDGRSDLYALIIEKVKSELTCGRKYCLNLLNRKGVSLNKLLVLSGRVPAEESKRMHLEDVEMALEDKKEEEEEEEEALVNDFEQEAVESGAEEIPLANYIEDLGDDVFNNEEGLAFLREFSSKCLMQSQVPPQKPRAITEGSPKVESPAQPQGVADPPGDVLSKITNQNVQKLFVKKRLARNQKLTLIKHDKVLTPQVLWSQNYLELRLKIIVENVGDYALECTATNLAFRCLSGQKLYAFDLKLYGTINPQMTRLTLKTFHVVIILSKLVSLLWPRLHRDEGRHQLVNLDVESLTEKDNVFAERILSVKRDMEAGILKKGVSDVEIRPCSDSEEAEEYFESESESD